MDLNASINSEKHELVKQEILTKQRARKVISSEKNLPNVQNERRKPVRFDSFQSKNQSQFSHNDQEEYQFGGDDVNREREEEKVNLAVIVA